MVYCYLAIISLYIYGSLMRSCIAEGIGFTAQGGSYAASLANWPDKGAQKLSAGGNATAIVKFATNIPALGHVGLSSPPNTYVKFTVGGHVAKSSVAINSLNPVWNERVSLGLLGTGTQIFVEIWFSDDGLQFSDSMAVRSTMRVPFCSTFNSNFSKVGCGQPFGCRSDDSLWAMPERRLCKESGHIPFVTGETCSAGKGICLFLDIEIVPFTMSIDLTTKNLLQTPVLNVAGDITMTPKWIPNFGLPFLSNKNTFLDFTVPDGKQLLGGLMLSVLSSDKSFGVEDDVKFYASVNFPANIYVCRAESDNKNGVPKWLQRDFISRNVTVQRLKLFGSDTYFGCFYYQSLGTVKNRYGGIKSGAIPFRSNTVAPFDAGVGASQDALKANSKQYSYMYIVVAIPRVIVNPEEIVEIIYDATLFIEAALSYGVIWWWFMFFTARFLKKIDYRIDRLEAFLSKCVLTGEKKSLVASLFFTFGQSPSNIEYRAHMFHARNVLMMILAIPVCLLISWGFSIAAYVSPAPLGFGIAFLGSAGVLLWFGFRLWETNGWRLSPMGLVVQGVALVLFFCFIISVIFVDPAVILYQEKLNFAALSILFGTMNLIPLILLVFKQDKTFAASLKLLMEKMSMAVNLAKGNNAKGWTPPKKEVPINKLLHALLGPTYSINPNVPLFKFATVLQDTPSSPAATSEGEPGVDEELEETHLRGAHDLYNLSLFFLFVYLVIGIVRTSYPSLAFLNCLTMVLFDTIHTSIDHGDTNWSPGYKIALLVLGRLFVMGSTGSFWMLNYSAAYLVYSTALIQEIINQSLPMLTAKQAGQMVFVGIDDKKEKSPDIAGSASFCFGLLTFAFCGILLVAAFGGTRNRMPTPNISVWWAQWPVKIFGLLALCVTITCGLGVAAVRAFYLQRHGLLRGWAQKNYLLRKNLDVPIILAIFTEVSIVTSGILIYGATRSSAVLICCIFIPFILLCFGYAYGVWLKNDFELVVWPPVDPSASKKVGSPSDLEVAFNMIEGIFGEENQDVLEDVPETEAPQEKTLKGFKLPAMEVTGAKVEGQIKMPALPLKSVLRKKRQTLGIKTKQPLVKDLKLREGADADKFGSENDVLDANDPWGQFEIKEEDVKKVKIKKKGTTFVMERRAWYEHPYIVKTRDALMSSKVVLMILKKLREWYQKFKDKRSKYAKIDVVARMTGEDEREDEEQQAKSAAPGAASQKRLKADTEEDGKEGEDPDAAAAKAMEAIPASERFAKMPFWTAVVSGFLTREEYMALGSWFGGLFAVFLLGITLSSAVRPSWLGQVVWVSIWMIIWTLVPVIKYFNTYTVDFTMKQMMAFAVVFHILFCASFFGTVLEGNPGVTASLWILDYFMYFPAFLYLLVELYRWKDSNFAVSILDKDGDNDISISEYLQFFKAYPILLGMLIILNWQMYLWVNYLVGEICTLFLLVGGFGYLFVRDWAVNDFFLSPEMTMIGGYMINITLLITFMISLFSSGNPIFSISIFFFTLMFRQSAKIVARILVAEADTKLFFSPFVFPLYSYNPRTNDIVDETDFGKELLMLLLTGAMWGAFTSTFLYPVNVGITVACVFILSISCIVAYTVCYVPMALGRYATMLTPEIIVGAASSAIQKFHDRKRPLDLEMKGWEARQEYYEDEKPKTQVEKHMERMSLELAADIINETRALTYVQDDSDYLASQTTALVEDDDVIPYWYERLFTEFVSLMKKLFEMIPIGQMKGWRRHSEAPITVTDALAESLITGRGPYGFIGVDGRLYKLFLQAQDNPNLKFLRQPWLNVYDNFANRKSVVELSEPMDMPAMLSTLTDMDAALRHTFAEESRSAIHFLILLMVSADANMQRETVLFQKFLRENRFRLASNGISPPADIFSSSSYSSINIALVAVWLSTLSLEERDRFHLLKTTFSEEQKVKDEAIDDADYQMECNATSLITERAAREKEMANKLAMEVAYQQEQRVQAFADTLVGDEKKTFAKKREIWTKDAECYVEARDEALYDKFKAACMQEVDEATELARRTLGEIEAAQKDCKIGEYGRVYQFVDSEFPPGDATIGECAARDKVLGWRCAPGITDVAQLFEGGTDPDDVEQGVFKNGWLLSAVSMLAAAGGINDGGVDEQIMNLFVGHVAMDGELTFHTELGAYCVRLFKQGQWIPIIVDDLFPMLRGSEWTNENRGMACAHSKECKELWVALLEKAYAKFYGSYAAIEDGYTHHALQDLTGCEAECIHLANAGRGFGKRALWESLVQAKANGYIMGAGTGSAALADKAILDMGIVFEAAYTLYDIRVVDGIQLITLRNPPGDHEEWKGDWSDDSPLWTRRLKGKLGFVNADDNTFYISFDDFCNVFRYVYVCKWYNPTKWMTVQYPSFWKKPNELDLEQREMMKQMMAAEGIQVETDHLAEKRKKARAQIDTAGGLPTQHNPGCVLANNPHFSLQVYRNTEVRITVKQEDSRGRGNAELLPAAILIVKNPHSSEPMRLKELNKDNVVVFSEVKKERTIYQHASLKPGLYIVLVAAYQAGMQGNFIVSVVSNYRSKFVPVWPPRWMLKGEKGATKGERLVAGGAGAAKESIDQIGKLVRKSVAVLFGAQPGTEDSDDEEGAES